MSVIDMFKAHLKDGGLSLNTVDSYIYDLNTFAHYFTESTGDDFEPQNITPMDIAEYRSYLQNVKGRKPATVNRALSSIRRFCEWAADQDLAAGGNPARNIQSVRRAKHAPQWLNRREQFALLREVEKPLRMVPQPKHALRDVAMIRVLLFCGLRASELCGLRICDITLSERKGIMTVLGKGNKTREVPINIEARRYLAEYIEKRLKQGDGEESKVFVGNRGPITPNCVWRVVTKFGARAGIEQELHPHRLRHTFVRNLMDQDVQHTDIAALTGHQDVNQLSIYGQPSTEHLQHAVDKVRVT
jgi:integrase/recombinase XerC